VMCSCGSSLLWGQGAGKATVRHCFFEASDGELARDGGQGGRHGHLWIRQKPVAWAQQHVLQRCNGHCMFPMRGQDAQCTLGTLTAGIGVEEGGV
jgi:hypothetical protein